MIYKGPASSFISPLFFSPYRLKIFLRTAKYQKLYSDQIQNMAPNIIGGIAVEASSASVASEQSVKSIVEVARSANAAAAGSANLASIARTARTPLAAHAAHHARHGYHGRRAHRVYHAASAAHSSNTKTVTETIHLITVDKAAPDLVTVTDTKPTAYLPSTGTSDHFFLTRSTFSDSSEESGAHVSVVPVIFVAVVGLSAIASLIWGFTRWLRMRRSASKRHVFYLHKPEQTISMTDLSKPQAAKLAEGRVRENSASTSSNGSIVRPKKSAGPERPWISGGTSV